MACYDTYRDQLASLYYGHALWVPDPSELYDRVRVGDVGYVKQGHFNRMFNALLPAKDDVQEYGVPEGFVPLNMGPFKNIRKLNLFQGDYCSNTVTVNHGDRHQAAASFRCSRSNKGAFLSLPLNGVREDAIRIKAFESYIRKHCDSWLEFASANKLDVRLEDIIFVTGCDLTASWAMAAFVNSLDLEVSLNVRVSKVGSARFRWAPTNQPHHNEPNQVRQSSLYFLPHRPRRAESCEITLRFHQGIPRETYSPLFQDVEGCCGASSRQSR
ncbi:hypothetical protein EDB83DRAFT_2235362 [Lactarius deliciosus]|nr:hypothetical protein EDB83DRAFT_2235362 [Lactarius deliciosus]